MIITCYELVCIFLTITNDYGHRYGHHYCLLQPDLRTHTGQHKLINVYFNVLNLLRRFAGNHRKNMHRIHAAEGASGSITTVMVFVRSFVLFVQSCNSLYVNKYHIITRKARVSGVTLCPTQACTTPHLVEITWNIYNYLIWTNQTTNITVIR